MTSLTLFWIAVGIAFLIIEMITVTFYGLSIALAAFVTGLFVWYTGLDVVTISQAASLLWYHFSLPTTSPVS
jgi:membrane protein implicated in regulation of membrane protease activity